MKKTIVALLLLATPCLAELPAWKHGDDVTISTFNVPIKINQSTPVLFDSPASGQRDCITKLTISADNFSSVGSSVTLLSAGATFYAISFTTTPVIDFWDYNNPICNPNPGTATYILVSTGSYKVNATGFTKPK